MCYIINPDQGPLGNPTGRETCLRGSAPDTVDETGDWDQGPVQYHVAHTSHFPPKFFCFEQTICLHPSSLNLVIFSLKPLQIILHLVFLTANSFSL